MSAPLTNAVPESPRVSVIIPCFNGERYLAEAISSALDQTHDNVEVVFVDDGSTDGSLALAKSFPGVTVLSQTNAGPSVARNAGLDASEGEFVVFLDADDRLHPTAVRDHLDAFSRQDPASVVFGPMRIVDATGAVLREPRRDLGYMRWEDVLVGITPAPSQCMFRREALVAAGGYCPDFRLAEDMDLILRIAAAGGVYCHGDWVCDYRRHAEQTTTRAADSLAYVMMAAERFLFARDDTPERAAHLRSVRARWPTYFGQYIPSEIARCLLKGDWKRAGRATGVFLQYLPNTATGSFQFVNARVRRLTRS